MGLWPKLAVFGILACGVSGWVDCVCLLFYDCAVVFLFGYLLLVA